MSRSLLILEVLAKGKFFDSHSLPFPYRNFHSRCQRYSYLFPLSSNFWIKFPFLSHKNSHIINLWLKRQVYTRHKFRIATAQNRLSTVQHALWWFAQRCLDYWPVFEAWPVDYTATNITVYKNGLLVVICSYFRPFLLQKTTSEWAMMGVWQ